MRRKIFLILLIFIFSIGVVSAADNETLPVENTDSPVLEDSSSGAFLVLDNDADKENIHVGEEVTWEVTVQNLGPEVSVNTKVHDVIPEGLEYLSHSASKGVFNPQTGIWDIGDLTVDDGQVTLYITCKAITVGEKINKATLTSDTFNLNNKSYEEEEIDVLDDDSDHEKVKKQMISDIYNTGNPLFLMLISLFCMMSLPFVKR